MIERCSNPNNKNYVNYGGRGIQVCARWMVGEDGRGGLDCFLEDMGPKPSAAHTIERHYNDGDYEPNNCSWANRTIQNRNKRSNVNLTYRGRTQNRAAWAKQFGLKYFTLVRRLKLGWSVERALTEPVFDRGQSGS